MAVVTLVNLNQIRVPLVAPYALDVLASALTDGGHDVDVLDLNLESDPFAAIASRFRDHVPDLVGLTLRNTGDLYFPSALDLPTHGSFLESHAALIGAIRAWVPRERLVIGGVGFSSNPSRLLERFDLPCGVVGPGEVVLCAMAAAVDRGVPIADAMASRRLPSAPHLALFSGVQGPLAGRVRRSFLDHRRYYHEGGLAGLRTSNGCAMQCTYCVEPFAKGGRYLRRAVDWVTGEIDQLLEAGIYDIHTCDSEFNMPIEHAKQVLRAIIERRYPGVLKFWAYCQPRPFDAEFAQLLARANFAGVNFGADHTVPEVLRALGKTWYTVEDIQRSTRLCHDHGIAVNHELLFGYPSDTPAAMYNAIDTVMALNARAMGVVVGFAVLPGTALARLYQSRVASRAPLDGFIVAGEPLVDPMFYVDPTFDAPAVFDRLKAFVGSESYRIMLPQVNSTSAECNQLVGSERIREDIMSGKRGAYWYHYPTRNVRPGAGTIAVAVGQP